MKMKKTFPVYLAFLAAVFLNAFVDLGHKIIIQNTIFKIYDGQTQIILTALVNGLILLPYILLLSPSGYIADKFAKSHVIKYSAWAAFFITIGITVCYYFGWFWPAFAMTLLLAIQSAFYAPAKQGYIKPLFGKEQLAKGNGMTQAMTITAILAGTLAYSILFEKMFTAGTTDAASSLRQIAPLGWLLIANAALEVIMVHRLPRLESSKKDIAFNWQQYRSGQLLKTNISAFWEQHAIRLSIIGLAVFWSLGQLMLAAFPTYAETQFGMTNTASIQAIMACSGIGIAIGSAIAALRSSDHIELGLIPAGAIGITTGLLALPYASGAIYQALCFLGIGISGGMFIVPLNALIQFNANDSRLGRILAANFWVQNVAMISILSLTVIAAYANISSEVLLKLAGLIALIGCGYTVYQLPFSLTRFVLARAFGQRYNISVQGLKNLPGHGGVLLLGNHVSWLDWAIVQITCPRRVRFVITKDIYNIWYLTWLFKLNHCIPISRGTSSAKALNKVSQALNNGELVCLFPEGTFSRTGQLGNFRKGYERACLDVNDDVRIVPFYIRGLWGSQFSQGAKSARQQRNTRLKRNIIFAYGQALAKTTTADELKRRVFDLSIESWDNYVDTLPTLPKAFIKTAKQHHSNVKLYDGERQLSGAKLFVASRLLADHIKQQTPDNIGIMLPTGAGSTIACMASLMAAKRIVPLNYTASPKHINSALEQANIKTVYTSRLFLSRLEQRGFDFSDTFKNLDVYYLEDIMPFFSQAKSAFYLSCFYLLPTRLLQYAFTSASSSSDTAAILFSSGSEGTPKGIMLSHKNFMANIEQVADVMNPQSNDVLLASLPAFHAFGLTVTQLLPIIEGIPVACHSDPTDAVGLGKTCARHKATLLFGTSTFLNLYARNKRLHPLMLDSLRLVIAGAEKLQTDVAKAFSSKFNKTILEGYGTTETTPVASVNLPDVIGDDLRLYISNKPGTAGMPLPGTSFKIVDPNTLEELPTGEAGMLLIGGSQVMQGYLNNDELNAQSIKVLNGTRWYITGDKGFLDEDGFLKIIDRYSRFAKIGGEMISLGSVEDVLKPYINDTDVKILAVNIPDDKKGEAIIVLVEACEDIKQLKDKLKAAQLNNLMRPKKLLAINEIPVLGSGKVDFGAAKSLALKLL